MIYLIRDGIAKDNCPHCHSDMNLQVYGETYSFSTGEYAGDCEVWETIKAIGFTVVCTNPECRWIDGEPPMPWA